MHLPIRTAPVALRAAQENRPVVKIHLLDGDTVQGRIEQVLDDGSVMLEKPGPIVSLVPYHAVAEFEFVS